MTDQDRRYHRRKKSNAWIVVGVIVLIILLIVWLTIADIWGDTDVAACLPPLSSLLH